MGSGKKEAARKERQGKTGGSLANVRVKGENFYRDAKKIKKINVLKEGRPQRNARGDITKAASYQSRDTPNARIEPNRKWFTNSRVIAQDSLTKFRDAIAKNQADPYAYLMKQNKIPLSLIRDDKSNSRNGLKEHEAKIAVENRPFAATFGPKAQRKRVKLDVDSLQGLAGKSEQMSHDYIERRKEMDLLAGKLGADSEQNGDAAADIEDAQDGTIGLSREPIFQKGQSKRIWNELYKVIDSSDVVVHVIDARDPEGSRCRHVEKYLREEAQHKHLVFILNKCDLVKTSVAAYWLRLLSKEHPTLAFRSHLTNSFGKGTLISLLRQFSSLHSNRKQISVGFIGYPNVGKSSIINTLRKKAVCKVSPVPGQTEVWQYITLMKRIFLIDCPGVVPPTLGMTDEDVLLRGAVRVENVQNPAQYIPAVLARVLPRHLQRTYDIPADAYLSGAPSPDGVPEALAFLEALARRSGKLLKGGEADVDTVAKSVINDFLRGKIPWCVLPPGYEAEMQRLKEEKEARVAEGKGGMLRMNRSAAEAAVRVGEKRKVRDDDDTVDSGIQEDADGGGEEVGDDEFEGLESDEDEADDDEGDDGLELNIDSDDLGSSDGSDVEDDADDDET